jgi:uncharacterized SAM-binding protein YcdF (DUF218 family)
MREATAGDETSGTRLRRGPRGVAALRLVWGTLAAALLALALTAHGIVVLGLRGPERRAMPERAPLVVVLGAGMAADGTLGVHTITRFEAGLRLVEAGIADRIHFSGGDIHRGIREGALMAEIARARLPGATITFEDRSRSTLQNAHFTVAAIGRLPAGTILVTDAIHLFRAWAAFTWAGSGALAFYPAKPMDPRPARQIARETAGVWLNLVRILRYTALVAGGRDGEVAAAALAQARP